MAERRTSTFASAAAIHDVAWLFRSVGIASGWFVTEADGSVMQPFYAALDGDQKLCWTDDRQRAQLFATKQAAERFAANRTTTDVCIRPSY